MGATKLRASTQLNADSADFTSLSVGGESVLTDASDLSGALTGKHVIQLVASADLTNQSGDTLSVLSDLNEVPFNPNSVATVAAAGSTNGIVALLETAAGMAIVAGQYNTNNDGIHSADAGLYQIDLYSTDGSRLMDGQDAVWGVFTTAARASGNDVTLRLFKGEWKGDGSQAPYTAAALDFFMAYPVLTDLSAMSRSAFRSDTIYLSKQAAGLLGASIGTAELEDDAVTTAKINDAAITTAKIDDDAVTAAKIADGAIDAAAKFGAGVVDTTALGVDAVTGAKIADDAVDSEHIAAGALDSEHFAVGSVDTTALGADAVTGAKVADDAIDSEHIADGAIDTAHLSAASVTGAKTSFANEQFTGADLTGGGSDTLTLAGTPVVATLFVFVGGALQRRGAGNDFTIATNVITFLSIPDAADNIEVIYMT